MQQLELFQSRENPEIESPLNSLQANGINLVYNKRLRNSWRLETGDSFNYNLVVPEILKIAPDPILWDLKAWAELMKGYQRKSKKKSLLKRPLENRIFSFLSNPINYLDSETTTHHPILKHWLKVNGNKENNLQPQGIIHDLNEVFIWVNQNLFAGKLQAKLTWSKRIGGLSYHNVQMDKQGDVYHLISISKGYDNKNASKEMVGGVVYHECLHIAIPPKFEGDRWNIHPREFRLKEKQYPYYKEWIHWHKTQLNYNLRSLKRKRTLERVKKIFFG